ncbi:MAG: hypothetical protein EZS28_002515 [Streblomastix strix]|uniref:Uncharacterized protein n=1 Tax=Streblomastix strix TaxID=222440 RepID=A0A5J4X409_9EUKA|nr:MAG: hypothetical protein EZS28_002515 [Streblomastix strix]
MDLLTQSINEPRTRQSGIKLDFHNLTDATPITVDFFHNDIRSPEDIDKFIEYVYTHEKGRLFKCTFDFGVGIERNEMSENMKEQLKNKKLIHKLQYIDGHYLATYRIKFIDNNFSYLHAPKILFDRNSINIFKEYVRSSILFMQEFGELTDTKELIVAIFLMQITSHRLPFPGKNMEELLKILKKKVLSNIFILMMIVTSVSGIIQHVQLCLIQAVPCQKKKE